jgi:putative peptidoglycan lipid II flippase
MALALLPALRRAGVRVRFRPKWRHPAVAQLVRLSGWTFGYVVANQVALVIVQNLADPGSGQQDAYAKAYTFFQLPHGLLAVSIMTTFTPDLARFVQRRDKAAFIDRTSLGVRLVALLTIPAGFGYFVLREPLIGALLQHGEFDAVAAERTADALGGFALGLAGFSVYLFVLRGFFAHQDTRTPFVINVGENVLNIIFAVVLSARYGVLGLGLAFAIAYLVSAAWALQVMAYKVPGFALRPLYASFWRSVLAAVLMAEAVWLVTRMVGSDVGAGAWVRVVVGVLVGLAVYVGVLALQRDQDVGKLRELVAG